MTSTLESPPSLQLIPTDRLCPHPSNVRRQLGDLSELAKSIKGSGILEPLLVLPAGDDDQHLVVAGHRRLAAAKKAGLDMVPCIVRDLDEASVIEAMLTENLQRAEISPVEEALAYARLVELDVTVKAIAAKVGRSQTHVKSRLDLVALPQPVLDQIESGNRTLAEAADLARLVDDDAVAFMTENPTAGVWQVRSHANDRRRARALDEERARLTKAGITEFVPGRGWYPPWKLPLDGEAAPVSLLELDKAASTHRLEPCHAVLLEAKPVETDGPLDEWKVERTTICTDPPRHTSLVPEDRRSDLQIDTTRYTPGDGGDEDADDGDGLPPAARMTAAAERVAVSEAAAAREAFARRLLNDVPEACPTLPDLVVSILLSDVGAQIPDPSSLHAWVTGEDADYREAAEWAATLVESDDVGLRQRIAWTAAMLRAAGAGIRDPQFWAMVDLLVDHGYEPHPYELEQQAAWKEHLEHQAQLRTEVDVDALQLDSETWDILAAANGGPQLIVAGDRPAVADLEARSYATATAAPAEGEGMVRLHFTALGRHVASAVHAAHHQTTTDPAGDGDAGEG